LSEPELSIIITTHNSEELIKRCIDSISSQTYPREKFEIVVVDDGSKDKSVKIANDAGADKIIEVNPCSLSKARNIGVENSSANLLAFIDSDCEAKKDWVKGILNGLKNVQSLSGPIYNGNPDYPVAWAEYFIEFGGFHEFRKKGKIRFLPGCNAAFTREVFNKAGGFTDLRVSDDVLFGESLRKAGVESFFIPDVEIYHICRTELNKLQNNMTLLGKYFVRTRRHAPQIPYTSLIRSRFFIPIIFLSKIVLSSKYAIQAKKLKNFVLCFPYVILGISSFCKGILIELSQKKK